MKHFLLMCCLMAGTSSFAQDSYSKYIQAVDEYVPAPGQFVNTMPAATAGDTPATMARKCTDCLAQNKGEMVNLGNFGGYITFHFDHPVVNVHGSRDLLLKGNAYAGNAEPGVVMVSQDTNGNGLPDDEWYELSGSADIDSVGKVAYGYEITYRRADMQDIPWTDNKGQSGSLLRVASHTQEYYPLWMAEDELTFHGTLLPNNATDLSGKGSYFYLEALRYGYADNLPNSDTQGNSFDIDWAVDADRRPVSLNHIDFVRIYSGLNEQCGWLGEASTEFAGAEDLHLKESIDYITGIGNTAADSADSPVTDIYTASGKRLNAPTRGLNIIRRANGTVKAFMIL